jgi:hypothetical protein
LNITLQRRRWKKLVEDGYVCSAEDIKLVEDRYVCGAEDI